MAPSFHAEAGWALDGPSNRWQNTPLKNDPRASPLTQLPGYAADEPTSSR